MAEGELQAAVQALYHHPDPKVKDQANRWLENWQQTVEAWQVADQVLHDGSASMEAHYFAAQTLRTKAIQFFPQPSPPPRPLTGHRLACLNVAALL